MSDDYRTKRRKLEQRSYKARMKLNEIEREREHLDRDHMHERVRECTEDVMRECSRADEYHVGWLMRKEDADLLRQQTKPGCYAFLEGVVTAILLRTSDRADWNVEQTSFSPATPDPDRGNYLLRCFDGVNAKCIRSLAIDDDKEDFSGASDSALISSLGTMVSSVRARGLVCVFLNKHTEK